jgi:hypothetical protein
MSVRGLSTWIAVMLVAGSAWAAGDAGGELRLRWDDRGANARGPLAEANALAPGIAPVPRGALVGEAELRGTWKPFSASLLLAAERAEGGATRWDARLNELVASGDFGAWQASAGKKIVGWDVGFGFRPNDVVQQEARRTLLSLTQEGRPLLQLEHFDAETASSLVWVNPQHADDGTDEQRFARESALAGRWYSRVGSADVHLFARAGHHTGASAGAALAWVAGDSLELHGSVRLLQRHDGWRLDPAAGAAPALANPWQVQTLGRTSQWLIGAHWTGAAQQSVMVEWWHDGTALSDAGWDAWATRGASLAAMTAGPPRGIGGNLAWQASPFAAANLRRENLFVRLAWQPGPWTLSLDALITPADRGRVVTAGVQWQGDRVRLNAAWRTFGGPADAVAAQLPQRHSGVVAASWAF